MNKEIEKKFNKLAKIWKNETANYKDSQAIVEHSAYQAIVDMGKDAVPFIIAELKSELRYWFPALTAIFNHSPVPVTRIGNYEKMREDWLKWLGNNGYAVSED